MGKKEGEKVPKTGGKLGPTTTKARDGGLFLNWRGPESPRTVKWREGWLLWVLLPVQGAGKNRGTVGGKLGKKTGPRFLPVLVSDFLLAR